MVPSRTTFTRACFFVLIPLSACVPALAVNSTPTIDECPFEQIHVTLDGLTDNLDGYFSSREEALTLIRTANDDVHITPYIEEMNYFSRRLEELKTSSAPQCLQPLIGCQIEFYDLDINSILLLAAGCEECYTDALGRSSEKLNECELIFSRYSIEAGE